MTREGFKPLAEFVEKYYEPSRLWPDGVLLDYICWAADNDFLFIARDKDENIFGAALARPVTKLPDKDDEFDTSGKIIFVDVMVATDKRAFQLLCFTILEHYKNCDTVAFQRLHRGSNKKLYDAKHVRGTLFKTRNLIYG